MDVSAPSFDFTDTERSAFSLALTQLFEHVAFSGTEALMLLGMNPDSRPNLKRYREGRPLQQKRDLLERTSHLFAIHLFLSRSMGKTAHSDFWARPNDSLCGMTPLQVAASFGVPGLACIRQHAPTADKGGLQGSRAAWSLLSDDLDTHKAISRLVDAFAQVGDYLVVDIVRPEGNARVRVKKATAR